MIKAPAIPLLFACLVMAVFGLFMLVASTVEPPGSSWLAFFTIVMLGILSATLSMDAWCPPSPKELGLERDPNEAMWTGKERS